MKELGSGLEIAFWQDALSLHQAPLLNALSTDLGVNVRLMTIEGVSDIRKGLGWESADFGSTTITTSANSEDWDSCLKQTRSADLHVFSGLGSYPKVDYARREVSKWDGERHIAVFSESWDWRGPLGLIRRARATYRTRVASRSIDTILTAGTGAYRQFSSLGFPPEKLMPFGYSVMPIPYVARDYTAFADTLEIVFVGTLAVHKDPEILLTALAKLARYSWRLTIVGDGELKSKLSRRVQQLGFEHRVIFTGRIKQEETRILIGESDLLVLPSRHDGWGAVVNEALSSGVRCIVSDAAGATDIVSSELQGAVFPHKNLSSLQSRLEEVMSHDHTASARKDLAKWADAHISPLAFANYLVGRLEHPLLRMRPPWKA